MEFARVQVPERDCFPCGQKRRSELREAHRLAQHPVVLLL